LTRGDRRRNDRIEALRLVVCPDRAILAIDLGEDKQVAVLMDHDGRVLGRRVAMVKAHVLGAVLGWAQMQAARHGFGQLVVGCEQTGHRWRAVMDLADRAGVGFVCVQSLKVHRARESDDYTRDKTDKDAVLIGKMIARLECYLPERAAGTRPGCGTWARGGPGWSPSQPPASSRSPTCWAAAGRRSSPPRPSPWSQRRG
jgi:hypothetical protein